MLYLPFLSCVALAIAVFHHEDCKLPLTDLEQLDGRYRAVFPGSEELGSCELWSFEIGSVLGHGNFGVVNKAVYKATKKLVAIKFQQHDSVDWYHFNRNEECIQHDLGYPEAFPFITKQFCTMVLANGTVGYVMELVEGYNLRHIVKGKVPNIKVENLDMRKIMAQLAVTIQYLHSRHIVMADLKTGNLMITKDGGNMKLIDFGLAIKTLEDGQVLKAPEWVSYRILPEHGNKPVTDWYAYGLLLYEALNGEGIFEQLQGKNYASSPLLRGEFCPQTFDQITCDYIKQFSYVDWDDIWGTTPETRGFLKNHPYFAGFDWRELDDIVKRYIE